MISICVKQIRNLTNSFTGDRKINFKHVPRKCHLWTYLRKRHRSCNQEFILNRIQMLNHTSAVDVEISMKERGRPGRVVI
jgi:hypothetical protein